MKTLRGKIESLLRKPEWLNLVANPFFLALPLSIIIILFLPNPSSKYEIKPTHHQIPGKKKGIQYYMDLNRDGIDEGLALGVNDQGFACFKIMNQERTTYDQWNFPGYFQKLRPIFYVTDLDGDGYPEIYVFFHRHDSVFMGAVQPYPVKKTLFEQKFVAKICKRNGRIDYGINGFHTDDFFRNGQKELVFFLDAGFSKQPRMICMYHSKGNKFTFSRSVGAKFFHIVVTDLDGDHYPEIYASSGCSANIDSTMGIPYNDYVSWFMGFDRNLRFLFPPIKNPNFPSSNDICAFTNSQGQKRILVCYRQTNLRKYTYIIYAGHLKEHSKKIFQISPTEKNAQSGWLFPVQIHNKPYFLTGRTGKKFVLCNERLQVKKIKSPLPENTGFVMQDDFNGDGNPEFLFIDDETKFYYITDDHFGNVVKVPTHITLPNYSPLDVGVMHCGKNPNQFYAKAGEMLYFYTYDFNPLYYLKYPLWLFIYGLVVLILWFTQRLQQLQIKKREEIEATINLLQMKTIKSQMDPHFMFNVLNGLANNVAMGNKEETYNQIVRFGRLLRTMMKKSEHIDTTLGEEMDFIRNYLELEKFRFKDDLAYSIDINPKVDRNIRIPRMLIQLLVENAIKHGLRNLRGKKVVRIEAKLRNGKTLIAVEDNGIGREAAAKIPSGTGKGYKLIRDMIRLNRKLGGTDISVNTIDLYDEKGNAAGTRVEVEIEPPKTNP